MIVTVDLPTQLNLDDHAILKIIRERFSTELRDYGVSHEGDLLRLERVHYNDYDYVKIPDSDVGMYNATRIRRIHALVEQLELSLDGLDK